MLVIVGVKAGAEVEVDVEMEGAGAVEVEVEVEVDVELLGGEESRVHEGKEPASEGVGVLDVDGHRLPSSFDKLSPRPYILSSAELSTLSSSVRYGFFR